MSSKGKKKPRHKYFDESGKEYPWSPYTSANLKRTYAEWKKKFGARKSDFPGKSDAFYKKLKGAAQTMRNKYRTKAGKKLIGEKKKGKAKADLKEMGKKALATTRKSVKKRDKKQKAVSKKLVKIQKKEIAKRGPSDFQRGYRKGLPRKTVGGRTESAGGFHSFKKCQGYQQRKQKTGKGPNPYCGAIYNKWKGRGKKSGGK
jgi:hypothetical protein